MLENEFSGIDIDGSLLRKRTPQTVLTLDDGCACCTKHDGFAASILSIANSLHPEVLVVEPTGISWLSNLMWHLKRVEYDRLEFLPPVALLNMQLVRNATTIAHEENLMKHASVLIATHLENCPPSEIEQRKAVWRKKNPEAEIVTDDYRLRDAQWFQQLLHSRFDRSIEVADALDHPSGTFQSITFSNVTFRDADSLYGFGSMISRGAFGCIYRVKGAIRLRDAWIRIDVTGQRFSLHPIEKPEEPAVVIIGESLNKSALKIYMRFQV